MDVNDDTDDNTGGDKDTTHINGNWRHTRKEAFTASPKPDLGPQISVLYIPATPNGSLAKLLQYK